MLEYYSLHFNQKIANCIIQLLNSGLKNARKIIRILCFLSNADVRNKLNLLNFNVLIKKDDQQHVVFHSIETKYVRNEKSKN